MVFGSGHFRQGVPAFSWVVLGFGSAWEGEFPGGPGGQAFGVGGAGLGDGFRGDGWSVVGPGVAHVGEEVGDGGVGEVTERWHEGVDGGFTCDFDRAGEAVEDDADGDVRCGGGEGRAIERREGTIDAGAIGLVAGGAVGGVGGGATGELFGGRLVGFAGEAGGEGVAEGVGEG